MTTPSAPTPPARHDFGQAATALIIVDAQADFAEGGSLAVAGGYAVSERIAAYVAVHGDGYSLVVATRDWHPLGLAGHFSSAPDYTDTWPAHCVQNTVGAEFLPAIGALLADGRIDVVVSKGHDSAAYSGFEGHSDNGATLDTILTAAGVTHLDVCGIATSHCVKATAADGQRAGYQVAVLTDLAVGVTDAAAAAALGELAAAGVTVTSTDRNRT